MGPGGEFLTHPHTLRHFRQAWYPDLLYRGGAEAWKPSQRLTFEQQLNARTRELIESHQPQPLVEDIAKDIRRIVARAKASPD